MAQGDSTTTTTTTTITTADSGKTLMARVATILGIDEEELQSAFTQAQKEMQVEALDTRLSELVATGKITQQQADEYKSWYNSKPDDSVYRKSLQEWQNARPEIASGTALPGIAGMDGRRGVFFPRGIR